MTAGATRTRRAMASSIVACLGGCVVHSQVNAPGHIDVQQPPADAFVERGVAEPPSDPGESILTLTYGPFAGGGYPLHEGARS